MQAVIISLEAPIFLKKDINSPIIQRLRKGDILYIHDGEFGLAPNEQDYEVQHTWQQEDEVLDLFTNPNALDSPTQMFNYMHPDLFYKTLNKNGVEGYIQGKHFKIIYKDTRELEDNTPYPEHDTTDYRLPEPLPPEYPFYNPNQYNLLVLFGVSSSRSLPDLFEYPITQESSDLRLLLAANYTKNISFDQSKRFNFGVSTKFHYEQKTFTVNNYNMTNDRHDLAIGPYISYIFHRSNSYFLTIYGSILLNYESNSIQLADESLNFTGFYPTIYSGLYATYRPTFIPGAHLVMGSEASLTPSFSLNKSTSSNITLYLKNSDELAYPLNAQITFFIGLSFF